MSRRTLHGLAVYGLAFAVVIVGAAWLFHRFHRTMQPPDGSAGPESVTSNRKVEPKSSQANASARPFPAGATTTLTRLRGEIDGALRALRELRGADPRTVLAKLAAALRGAPPEEAIAAIEDFLAGGEDAPTEGQFSVGEGGVLENTTTLRVFLLDQLGQLARVAGRESDTVSREILDAKKSPDEWAVALRNVAWSEKGTGDFLAGKLREMLTYKPWIEAPSPGLLEAFDVAVYTRDVQSIPVLADFFQQPPGSPLRRAAAVALDRLSAAAPLEVMTMLNNNPALFAETPMIRADFYTKADLTQPLQRLAVETYLARPDVSAGEKSKFLDGLFTPGEFVSDNLLTTSSPPAANASANRAAVVEGVARDWLMSRRFPQQEETLSILLERSGAE